MSSYTEQLQELDDEEFSVKMQEVFNEMRTYNRVPE
jgi:hypothetical protein